MRTGADESPRPERLYRLLRSCARRSARQALGPSHDYFDDIAFTANWAHFRRALLASRSASSSADVERGTADGPVDDHADWFGNEFCCWGDV